MEKIKVKNVRPLTEISENVIVEPVNPPSGYSLAILMALQGKHVYSGTVSEAEKARRRAANKVARKSRKNNR